jgi:hypothetical protein
LVLCGEDQAVELDDADGWVSDAFAHLGGQSDLVLIPERRELGAIV